MKIKTVKKAASVAGMAGLCAILFVGALYGKEDRKTTDVDGKEITKYFDAEVKDSTSIYLQNMIEEALDDFGDTLEMNQKVAVLVQTIEKLLKK